MDRRITTLAIAGLIAVAFVSLSGCSDILFLKQLKEIVDLGSGVISVRSSTGEISEGGTIDVSGMIAPVQTPGPTFVFTVENQGIKELYVTDIRLDPLLMMDYSLSPPMLPWTIPAGGSMQFFINFNPGSGGMRSFPITIVSSDADTEFHFKIGGRMPGWINSRNINYPSKDMVVRGNYAYIADDTTAEITILYIGDYSFPQAPIPLPIVGVNVNAVALYGDFLLVGGEINGTPPVNLFSVWDLSVSPTNPQLKGSITNSSIQDITGIAVGSTCICVSSNTPAFYTLTVSPAGTPAIIGFFDYGSVLPGAMASSVTASGQKAYLVFSTAGPPPQQEIAIFDISDPFNPSNPGSCSLSSPGKKIALNGTVAYITMDNLGFEAIDVSNPFAPFSYGNISTNIGACHGDGILVSYPFLYAGFGSPSGIRVFNIAGSPLPFMQESFLPTAPIDMNSISGISKIGEYLVTSSMGAYVHVFLLPQGQY